ncbi:MAG: hypothetical protein K8W52_31840 [Deltaproteobacteria bacterium]|nr:hypothetical protein [Deltaproteobacteria bacterium]
MLRVVRVVASGCIYVGATGLHLPLLGLGAAGLALSFVDLRRGPRLQLPPGSAELVLGARELRVDDHEVIALAEIGGSDDRDFTLRVMLVRDQRFSRWATVWYGPEDERRWIGQLVSAAIAAARARTTSSPSWP